MDNANHVQRVINASGHWEDTSIFGRVLVQTSSFKQPPSTCVQK
jgi:hypothetical protein